MTEWIWRLHLFVPIADISGAAKVGYARAIANNGGRESEANELLTFDKAGKFSSNGKEPTTVVGICTPLKNKMRTALQGMISSNQTAIWVQAANVAHSGLNENEVVASNLTGISVGDSVSTGEILTSLKINKGWQPIILSQ